MSERADLTHRPAGAGGEADRRGPWTGLRNGFPGRPRQRVASAGLALIEAADRLADAAGYPSVQWYTHGVGITLRRISARLDALPLRRASRRRP